MGRCRGGKRVQKRAAATNCYSPFGCHYSRDIMLALFQTLSNLVSVFFKMNTLSAIFVHCLPKDGSFLKAENLDFCNFPPHFRPHALPPELPTFSPFQGDRFAADIPTHLLSHSLHHFPFQGDTLGRFRSKIMEILPKFGQFVN